MFRVLQITADAKQKKVINLPDGGSFEIALYFMPMQQSWFITSFKYLGFELNGIRVCNSPNLLYQFRNQLPFGLACFSVANREPSLIEDFVSGASNLYVLNEEEVAAYTRYLSES